MQDIEIMLANGNVLRGGRGKWHVGEEGAHYQSLIAAYASTFRGSSNKHLEPMTLVEFAEALKDEEHLTIDMLAVDDMAQFKDVLQDRCLKAYAAVSRRASTDPLRRRTLEALTFLGRLAQSLPATKNMLFRCQVSLEESS